MRFEEPSNVPAVMVAKSGVAVQAAGHKVQASAPVALPALMLLNHEHLAIQDAEVVAAALEHYRRKPSLGFSDCLVLEAARKAGHLPLGTFDRNLGKLDGAQRV